MSEFPAPLTRALPGRTERSAGLAVTRARIALGGLCTALGAVLVSLTRTLPPHEDEALALLVGHEPLGDFAHTILRERGGAPLHFLLAWAIVHAGGGLETLRLASTLCVVASVPALYALVVRLAGRPTALVAVVLASASWMLLFHGVFGRMYGLFLLASTLSYAGLVRALERGERRDWAVWASAALATVAVHPYGALVLVTQALHAALHRQRRRRAAIAFALVGLACLPFWFADLVLAKRFGAGVGGGGRTLGSPESVASYLGHVAGDFSAGWIALLTLFLGLAALGAARLARERPRAAQLAALVLFVPALALTFAKLGHAAVPRSRHLIFALPFFSMLVARGLVAATRRGGAAVLAVVTLTCVGAEIGWAWHKTPGLFQGDAAGRTSARAAAGAWLRATTRRGDVLFGYEPPYIDAWHGPEAPPRTLVPRADAGLMLDVLERAPLPLGRGAFVLDAGDVTSLRPRDSIPRRLPTPADRFTAVRFGPYLVVRTRSATMTPAGFLRAAAAVQRLGVTLAVSDAGVNLAAVTEARRRLDAQLRAGTRSVERSRSTSSS